MASGSQIIVGVCGGIAAYKTITLVRLLCADGYDVIVVPTESSLQFIGKATWEAITGQVVATGVFDSTSAVEHVELARSAKLIIIAPATADTIARLAHGRSNDLLSAVVLSAKCPILLAPAMHTQMWENCATQDNVGILRKRNFSVIGPGTGALTSGDSGVGRLVEPEELFAVVRDRLRPQKLQGKKVLISAGGTREPIDDIRFIANRSSGKQGNALASAALAQGASVTLVCANVEPTVITPGATLVEVETAAQMHQEMTKRAAHFDIIIMAAAVADYTPAKRTAGKLRKSETTLTKIALSPTKDILQELVEKRMPQQTIVGFAAETGPIDQVRRYAKDKVRRKGCDLLVVNQVGPKQGFGTNDNHVEILNSHGQTLQCASGSKLEVAQQILDQVLELRSN